MVVKLIAAVSESLLGACCTRGHRHPLIIQCCSVFFCKALSLERVQHTSRSTKAPVSVRVFISLTYMIHAVGHKHSEQLNVHASALAQLTRASPMSPVGRFK
jgi:hypothetical protein